MRLEIIKKQDEQKWVRAASSEEMLNLLINAQGRDGRKTLTRIGLSMT